MINVPTSQIDKGVIEGLVTAGVPESRTLDYKERLPGPKSEDRKEFLADVSAMANAAGGDIVFGIAERREDGKPTGIPERVSGLAGVNLDSEQLRLESMLRDGIDPRIIGLQLIPVKDVDGGPVVVIRVPKSYASPHMVKAGDSRFYSRHSTGKYPLDVTEIRSAFALSEALPERIRRFRDERVARIIADETPVKLPPSPKAILHVLPISAFANVAGVDVSILRRRSHEFRPLCQERTAGGGPRYNLDGVLVTGVESLSIPVTYLQLFRNGAIEAVEITLLRSRYQRDRGETPVIPSTAFESTLILGLDRYIRLMKEMQLSPPAVVMLTLTGVLGYRMVLPPRWFGDGDYEVDRDTLMLPDSLVQDFETPADLILKPALDALWQSVGFEKDLFYGDHSGGRWVESADSKPLV